MKKYFELYKQTVFEFNANTYKFVSFFNSPISGGIESCNLFHRKFLTEIKTQVKMALDYDKHNQT
jgi:hypothetical protein